MRGIVKAFSFCLVLGGGIALAARPAAAVNYWPSASPYACTWSKPNSANPNVIDHGVSTVKFANMVGAGPYGADYQRAGRLQTTYSGGAVSDVGVNLWWDFMTGDNYFDLATDSGVQCRLRTSSLGHTLIIDFCNNGAVQNCTQ